MPWRYYFCEISEGEAKATWYISCWLFTLFSIIICCGW